MSGKQHRYETALALYTAAKKGISAPVKFGSYFIYCHFEEENCFFAVFKDGEEVKGKVLSNGNLVWAINGILSTLV